MSYHFFALLARLRYIDRWSLMLNHYPENVAEHSLMVAVLAHALALIGRELYGRTDADPDRCAAAALYHDAPEIITGDMPSPVKYYDADIRAAYRRVEEASVGRLLDVLPDELRGAYDALLRVEELDEVTAGYVKAADKLSAYLKCIEELRGGNTEFADAAAQTRKKLEEMQMNELSYFFNHFLPSFELTLDGLR